MLRGRELKLLYFFLDFLRNVSSVSLFQDILNHYVEREKKCVVYSWNDEESFLRGNRNRIMYSFYNIQGPI